MSVVAGIFICWVALFAPGILLIYGFMPWWGGFRHFQVYRRLVTADPPAESLLTQPMLCDANSFLLRCGEQCQFFRSVLDASSVMRAGMKLTIGTQSRGFC